MRFRHPLFCLGLFLASLVSCSTQPPPIPAELAQAQARSEPPTRDAAGWTRFSPGADTRIVYVSSSDGDDGSGKVYRASDESIGTDPRNPAKTIRPFKTFSAAFRQTRDGRADWVLLKNGDTFSEPLAVRSGRSAGEPFLLSSYGKGNKPPLIDPGKERAINICCKSFNDIAIQGLDFYAAGRDFDSPRFASTEGGLGISVYVGNGERGQGLLVEGCRFRFFTGNAIQADGRLTDVVFRRNVITDSYSTKGHAQGLYARNVSFTVEENIFDHNGWYKQQETDRVDNREGGQATMFNHNTYFQDTYDVVFRNNILLRPSSIGSKWTANQGEASSRNLWIENNFYYDGEIGISIGGNKKGAARFHRVTISDNVLLNMGQLQPTDRDFAWYLEVHDWDKGRIDGNLFIHPGSETTDNVYAMRFDGQENREVNITDNIIYGFGNGYAVGIEKDTHLRKVNFVENEFYLHDSARRHVRLKGPLTGVSFSDNRYLSEKGDDAAFAIGNSRVDWSNWRDAVGDTGSSTGRAKQIDTTHMVEGYLRALKKKPSFDVFVEAVRDQSFHNWQRDFTAEAINDWIRANLPGLERKSLPAMSAQREENETR